MEDALERHGFPFVSAVVDENANAKMLNNGRIDAWLVGKLAGKYYYEMNGFNWDDLRVGACIGVIHMCMAASKDIDPETAALWRAGFASMREDGSLARILSRYGMAGNGNR